MKETFIIVGSNYGIATFIDLKSKTVINKNPQYFSLKICNSLI